MTLSDRIFIEQALVDHSPFKDIAAVLKKDPSTISKEIRKHRSFKQGSHYNLKNNCALLSSCRRSRICGGKLCSLPCRQSRACDCTKHCPDFTPYLCPRLSKPPYVCNGCHNHACRHDKYFYRAKDADSAYEQTKHECRQGINLSSEERASLDELVSPLILKGQTIWLVIFRDKNPAALTRLCVYRVIKRQCDKKWQTENAKTS